MKLEETTQDRKAKIQTTIWITERMPQIVVESSITNNYDTVLINVSSVIADMIKSKKYLKEDENEFIMEFEEKFKSLIISLKPQKSLVIGIDGVLPLQKAKMVPRSSDIKQISERQFLPGTELCNTIYDLITKIVKQRAIQNSELNFILLGPNMPGEALYKMRIFIISHKNKPGFQIESSICLVDSTDSGLLSALSLHLPKTHLRRGFSKQLIDIGLLRQLVITEFSLLNNQGTRDYEAIIDDFILLALLSGSDSLPGLYFFSQQSQQGMNIFFYLYKRMYPFLNGSLSSNGIIYTSNLHLYFHELGIIEDSIASNRLRTIEVTSREINENNRQLEALVDTVIEQLISKQRLMQTNNLSGYTLSYKSYFSIDQKKTVFENTLKSASSAFKDFIVDINKYGERFLEGICEDDSDDEQQTNQPKDPPITLSSPIEGERGFKNNYYMSNKRCILSDIPLLKSQLEQKYLEGIIWHFASYFKEYPSWNWEYNYHFAPFAEDMRSLGEIQISFSSMAPLSNSQQLILLSPTSTSSLPSALIDQIYGESSTLADLLPIGFENGQFGPNSLGCSEIQRFLSQVQKLSQFNEFSQTVDRLQNYPILIAHQRRFLRLPSQNTPQDPEKSYSKKHFPLLDIEKHNISAEVPFFMISNYDTITIEADVKSSRIPIVPIQNGFIALSEKQKETILETISEIHSRVYANNPEMLRLERSLSISVDANEIFNRGITSQIQYPILKSICQILPLLNQIQNINKINGYSSNKIPSNFTNNSSYSPQPSPKKVQNHQNFNNIHFSQNYHYYSLKYSRVTNNQNKFPPNANIISNNSKNNNNFPSSQYQNQQGQSQNNNNIINNNNNKGQEDNFSHYDNYGHDNNFNVDFDNHQKPPHQNKFAYSSLISSNISHFTNESQRGKCNLYEPNSGEKRGNFKGAQSQNDQGNVNRKRNHPDQRLNQNMSNGRKQFQPNKK